MASAVPQNTLNRNERIAISQHKVSIKSHLITTIIMLSNQTLMELDKL